MTSPKPRHVGHTRDVTTWPRNDRWTLCTSPRPLQMSQRAVVVPGAQPWPEQSEHSTAVSTGSSRVTPVAHSSKRERHADERVGAGLHPAARAAGTPADAAAAAEEGVHDVAEARTR